MNLQFSAETAVLRRHVAFLKNGLGASKTDIPVMIFRCDLNGPRMTMFASNKEMFTRTEVKVENPTGASGVFSLMGMKLDKLLTQIEAETVSFDVDDENCQIQAAFLTINFETYDGSTLGTIEKGLFEHLSLEGISMPKASFEEALECARACTTTSSIRPDVTHVEFRGGQCLSSDGRKIMIYSNTNFDKDVTFKVPATSLADVLSSVKALVSENVAIAETASHYFIKSEKSKYTLGIRKTERSFPAVEAQLAMTEDPSDVVSIDKTALTAMLRGVALALPSEEVKVLVECGGEDREAYCEISGTNSLGRRSHERASAGRTATGPLVFPISFQHIIQTLGVFKGDSVVDMNVYVTKNLLMVIDSTDTRVVKTIIPFRTDAQIEKDRQDQAAAEAAKAKEAPGAAAARGAAGAAAMAALDDGENQDVDLDT